MIFLFPCFVGFTGTDRKTKWKASQCYTIMFNNVHSNHPGLWYYLSFGLFEEVLCLGFTLISSSLSVTPLALSSSCVCSSPLLRYWSLSGPVWWISRLSSQEVHEQWFHVLRPEVNLTRVQRYYVITSILLMSIKAPTYNQLIHTIFDGKYIMQSVYNTITLYRRSGIQA